MTTGADALRHHAPAAADALDALVVTMWTDVSDAGLTGIVTSCSVAAGGLLALPPLLPPKRTSGEPGSGTADDGAVRLFAEQACLDVASVTDDQRAAFLGAAGDRAGTLAAALWVVEFIPRTRAALDSLFSPGRWPEPTAAPVTGGVWAALDGLIRAVPALDRLDPVTSELVRLRGARQHDCRLCRSLRSRTALRAGATEEAFRAVDDYANSDLSPLQRAALAFTEAMIWTPGRIDDSSVTGLRAETDPDQRVELVLDVTRNALNKVAVALGADAAHVEDGIEIYDVGPDGSLLYGLEPD
jgi:AhpD family alkylhydroperoxidase